jgi:hypothetical protein
MSLTQRKRLHTDSAGTKPPFVVVVRPENHVVSCQDFDPASRYGRERRQPVTMSSNATKRAGGDKKVQHSRKKKMVKSESKKGHRRWLARRAHAAASCSSRRFSSETHSTTQATLIIVKQEGWCQRRLQDGRHGAPLARPKARARRESVSGRRRSRPARAGETASLSPALERAPGREAGGEAGYALARAACGRECGARARWRLPIGSAGHISATCASRCN